MWRALTVLVFSLSACRADNSYLVTAPNTVRPGQPVKVSVMIFRADAPVNVEVVVTRNRGGIADARGSFVEGEPGILSIPMPVDEPGTGEYHLSVMGTGGLSFNQHTPLKFDRRSFSIFIQTDKGMYKAGQTVRYRVFATYPDLKPYMGTYKIELFDAKNNKIKQHLKAQGSSGVFTNKLALADHPILGEWTIRVESDDLAHKQEAKFGVYEYVLPKFEVSVDLPAFLVLSGPEVLGTVVSKYTFGKGVKGSVVIEATLEPANNRFRPVRGSVQKTFLTDGKADFRISFSELQQLHHDPNDHVLVVKAKVTEDLTGIEHEGEGEAQIYRYPNKIEYDEAGPDHFKPGLDFDAYVRILQQDGSPLTSGNMNLKVKLSYSGRRLSVPPYETTIRADSYGYIRVFRSVPRGTTSMTLEVTHEANAGVRMSKVLQTMLSPSNNYLRAILMVEPPVKVGEDVMLQLEATELMTTIYYQVYARGLTVLSGKKEVFGRRSGNNVYMLQFGATASMGPVAHVHVFYVRPDGEVVNDGISFSVSGIYENQVSLHMSDFETRPGNAVDVRVSADRDSHVGVVAVDQSALLLRSAHDVDQATVLGEVRKYDSVKMALDRYGRPIAPSDKPASVEGKNAKDVFHNTGLVYLTDLTVSDMTRAGVFGPGPLPPIFPPIRPGVFPPPTLPNVVTTARTPDLEQPTRVRKFFPETWIWTDFNMTSSGHMTLQETVPDTMTSWIASAFAVHTDSGLGVVDAPYKLRVFKPFFLSLNLPYSVVRGEHVVIHAIVFNYLDRDTRVKVTLEGSDYFDVIKEAHGNDIISEARNQDIEKWVDVPANTGQNVFFCLVARTVGPLLLKLKARSPLAADALERRLLVKPEGIPQEYTENFLVTLRPGYTFEQTVRIDFPDFVVDDSQRVSVTAIGDVMGSPAKHLDLLLKLPTGCCEQIMVKYAPNVFVLQYLDATQRLTDDIYDRGFNLMEKGYQNLMERVMDDGSFSVWGPSGNSPSSMWLTAFVTKCMHHVQFYTYVDPEVKANAVKWIISHQNQDGTFPETGRVYHKDMQGGAGAGERLTAYVLITLLEIDDLDGATERLMAGAKLKCVRYLERRVRFSRDAYTLSLMNYAFTLAGNRAARSVRNKLNRLSTRSAGMQHWEAVAREDTPHRMVKPMSVEMTAYNLLAYVHQNNERMGYPLLRWLAKQRNGLGGFKSTQDTTIGLQALAGFSALIYTDEGRVRAEVTARPETHTFHITPSNDLVLQSFLPRSLPDEVELKVEGTGLAVMQVLVNYYVTQVPQAPAFEIWTEILEEQLNSVKAEVCIRYRELGDSGMAVVEQTIPSGFTVGDVTGDGIQNIEHQSTETRRVFLYYDSFGLDPTCYTIQMTRVEMVAHCKPSYITVFDYYDPDDKAVAELTSPLLEESNICDICATCLTCA